MSEFIHNFVIFLYIYREKCVDVPKELAYSTLNMNR